MKNNAICITSICVLVFVILTSISFSSNYFTKETELSSLRLTTSDLQKVLNRIFNLIAMADAKFQNLEYYERVNFESGKSKVKITNHDFISSGDIIPKVSYGFKYEFRTTDDAPISNVSIDLNDMYRKIEVNGYSPEQVDAIFSSIESDLREYSTPLGGYMTRYFCKFILFIIFASGLLLAAFNYFEKKNIVRAIVLIIFSLIGFILLFTLPFRDILAGFALYQGEASLLVRYGYQISFSSLVITILGIPLSYFLPSLKSSSKATD